MTQPPSEPDVFYIAPAYSDSTGRSAIPGNALFVGSRSAVMERILDSKARRTALSLINDDRTQRQKRTLGPTLRPFRRGKGFIRGRRRGQATKGSGGRRSRP